MRTTRRPRSLRRRETAEPFAGTAPFITARDAMHARLGLMLLAQRAPVQPDGVPAARWTALASDPVLRRVLDAGTAPAARNDADAATLRDLSVANDRLRLAEHLARVRVDALERRARLQSAVAELLEVSPETLAESPADVLSRLGCLLVPALADFIRIDLLEEDGALQAAAVVHNGPARSNGWLPDGAPVQAQAVARGGSAVVLNQGDELPSGFHALGCLPLRARGRTLGVMTLATTSAVRGLDAEDVRLAEEIARGAAVAMDNARLLVHARAEARCKEQALAAVSHEMRSPLQVISIASGALLRAWPADASLLPERRQIAVIAESAERMRRLAGDLLDVAQMDAGAFDVAPETVRVGVLLHSAVEVYRPLAAQKGITLSVSPFPTLSVDADEQRVHQVFANLIGNAVRHTPAGGAITLSAQAGEGQVRFSVTDTGAGIAPENVARVFDRFWSGGRCRGCAGLGLAISRAIIEAHGGAMSVESQPGQGTTFTFTLPLAGV